MPRGLATALGEGSRIQGWGEVVPCCRLQVCPLLLGPPPPTTHSTRLTPPDLSPSLPRAQNQEGGRRAGLRLRGRRAHPML